MVGRRAGDRSRQARMTVMRSPLRRGGKGISQFGSTIHRSFCTRFRSAKGVPGGREGGGGGGGGRRRYWRGGGERERGGETTGDKEKTETGMRR
jgi:hypothetical protein